MAAPRPGDGWGSVMRLERGVVAFGCHPGQALVLRSGHPPGLILQTPWYSEPEAKAE
jgi:hypothetical protein